MDSIVPFQIFRIKSGTFDPTSTAVISRRILFPKPVVTDRFVLTVESGATPLVFKMDIIGMDPDKKYATDPILTPKTYQDCKIIFLNPLFSILLVLRHIYRSKMIFVASLNRYRLILRPAY